MGEPAERQANKKRQAPTTFYCVWTAPPDPELLHESLVMTLAELLAQQRAAGGQVKKVEYPGRARAWTGLPMKGAVTTMQQEKTNPGGEKELAQGWAAAVATLDHWVEKTYNQAVRVSEMAHGPNRVLEVHTFLGDMSQARGALVIMKVIRGDEDPQLEDLMARLNHCPLVMVAGPSIGKKPTPEAQQLRLHLVQ